MHRKASPILFALVALLASCGWPSWPTPTAEPGAFAIYLLEGNLSPKEIAGLDLAGLPLQDEPVLAQDDLEAYVWDRHELVLTPEAVAEKTIGRTWSALLISPVHRKFVLTISSYRLRALT